MLKLISSHLQILGHGNGWPKWPKQKNTWQRVWLNTIGYIRARFEQLDLMIKYIWFRQAQYRERTCLWSNRYRKYGTFNSVVNIQYSIVNYMPQQGLCTYKCYLTEPYTGTQRKKILNFFQASNIYVVTRIV